jgi:hypothetical protein
MMSHAAAQQLCTRNQAEIFHVKSWSVLSKEWHKAAELHSDVCALLDREEGWLDFMGFSHDEVELISWQMSPVFAEARRCRPLSLSSNTETL